MDRNTSEHIATLTEFDKALIVASHFGFMPIATPKITKEDIDNASHCSDMEHYDACDKAAFIRTYLRDGMHNLPHPLAVSYKKPVSRKKYGKYTLHIVGNSSGLTEATLVRTALSILREDGVKNLSLNINCIGDKDSISAYERELTNFTKKTGGDWPEDLKEELKEDIFNIFRSRKARSLGLHEVAPPSMISLTAQARAHFKEVLEYLEQLGIEFHLSPELVGEKHHATHTIFAIRDADEEDGAPLAVGYRYTRLGKRLGLKKDTHAASVTIFPTGKESKGRVYKGLPKAKFHLVQLGEMAKIRSLALIELLRSHKIPVYHMLGNNKITGQLEHASELGIPYLIIVGQKEAYEGTATVRNVSTRAQDTVSLEALPDFLKHLPI